MSVCLSFSLSPRYKSAATGLFFNDILYSKYFLKYAEKIEIWLKFVKNKWNFTWRRVHIYDISLKFYEKEKYFRQQL